MANDTTLVEGPEYEDDDDQMANDTTLVEDPEYEDDDDQMANGTTLVEGPEYEDDDQESSGKAPDLSHAEKNELLLNMAREYHTRQESFTQIQGDWSESEIALLQKLNMRGFEPLLPEHWMMDFNTIPEPLFTEKDQEVLINSASGRDFRATKALASLLSLGVRVREKIDTSLPPEGTIRREIESYIKWSEIDGRLTTDHHVPVLTVATTKPGQDIQEVVDIVTAKLHALARRYRDKWRIHSTVEASRSKDPADTVKDEYAHDLPTLYGMVISHTVVTFVSHTTAVPYMPVRSIALFDFGDDEHDVWNGFAVAILVVMVRNYLMGLHKFESGTKGAGETKKSDPDA
ncbi:MAG: hypothetical protein M1830_006465 [Pleopsidium flavum]|nr:MAG: hypothetical protein M1830_006465 [Pleopsidium flavum]